MSVWLTGGVALGYATGVLGLHRLAVHRRRALAMGYAPLRWLDWGTLLDGVQLERSGGGSPWSPELPEGGPAPTMLREAAPTPGRGLLQALVLGQPVQREAFAEAPFSVEQARWLDLLCDLRDEPTRILEALEAAPATSVREAYLREWLTHEHHLSPLTLELRSFASKRRLNAALTRFGDAPALYFARARASALLGFTSAVLDDVARAVYFSREAPFYVEAVISMPFVDEVRPALARACRSVAQRISGAAG